MNYLEKKVNQLKNEILDLKTACIYSSVRPACSTVFDGVYTGIYKVTYSETDEYIASIPSCSIISGTEYMGVTYPRTAQNGIQLIEVSTDYTNFDTQEIETGTASLIIISNFPVSKIERI